MELSFKHYRALLGTYLRPEWGRVLLVMLLLFSGIGLALLSPQLIQMFIDTASSGGSMQTLVSLALFFLGVALLRQLIALGETAVAENVGLTATNHLRADLMLHCLSLGPAFFAEHTPGELIERVDGDVAQLGNFFARFLVSLVGNALLLIGVLIMFFRVDWRIGLVMTLFVGVSLTIVVRLRFIAVPLWEKGRQASADLFGFLEERLLGTEDIRSSGATQSTLNGLAARSRQVLHTLRRAVILSMTSWSVLVVLSAVGIAIALGFGVWLYQSHQITLGTAYLIFGFASLLNQPIEQIIQQMRDLQQATGSITRIQQILDLHSTLVDGPGASLAVGPLELAYDQVSFAYSSDVPVLKGINFSLRPGEVLGLLGRTGSGKSTLVQLIARLYDPAEGMIRLNGVDLREMRLHNLRERIGMVTQQVHVLHTTLRNNLTLFDPSVPDEKIIQALYELGLDGWYQALPEGLDTVLQPGGGGLSAGEAQLLSLARVFLRDPGLVILDEASARLDPATERLLEQALDRLLAGRTSIIIAHHLGTVQRADTILILEDGRTCEYGQRTELAALPESRFAQLLRVGLEEVLV